MSKVEKGDYVGDVRELLFGVFTSPEVVWILFSIQWEAMEDFKAGGDMI